MKYSIKTNGLDKEICAELIKCAQKLIHYINKEKDRDYSMITVSGASDFVIVEDTDPSVLEDRVLTLTHTEDDAKTRREVYEVSCEDDLEAAYDDESILFSVGLAIQHLSGCPMVVEEERAYFLSIRWSTDIVNKVFGWNIPYRDVKDLKRA